MAKYVKVTEATGRRIVEMLQRTGTIGGRGVNSSIAGTTIHATAVTKPINRRQPPPLTLFKITSITSPVTLGGEKYWGRLQVEKANAEIAADSDNLVMSDLYEDADEIDVVLLNPSAAGQNTHVGALNSFHWCLRAKDTSDGYPCYWIVSPAQSIGCS